VIHQLKLLLAVAMVARNRPTTALWCVAIMLSLMIVFDVYLRIETNSDPIPRSVSATAQPEALAYAGWVGWILVQLEAGWMVIQ
jgi:hypothetical protein